MLRKLLFVAILALQAAVVCNVATADYPWPICPPCPDAATNR